MEKQISDGAMLGIVLIALAAIIGLGFGVFAIAKGTANEGVTNVQDNLNQVGASAFTDFDQKIVTGTQVMSSYQNFEGKSIAILVATQGIKDGTILDKGGITTATGAVVPTMPTNYNKDKSPAIVTNAAWAKNSAGGEIKALTFINYNALLGSAGTSAGTKVPITMATLTYEDGTFRIVAGGLATMDGKVAFNASIGNLAKSGMGEYIPSGAKFQSNLIKDKSGTIMGIAFEQIGAR